MQVDLPEGQRNARMLRDTKVQTEAATLFHTKVPHQSINALVPLCVHVATSAELVIGMLK